MEVMYERCAALDVHKKTVAACLIVPDANGRPKKEKRVFKTMTQDLLSLSDWLLRAGCTHVAMESTGVYWKPVYNILETNFEILLANAREGQFHSAETHSGTAGSDPLPHQPGPAKSLRGESATKIPGGRQHQAGFRGHGHHRRLRKGCRPNC